MKCIGTIVAALASVVLGAAGCRAVLGIDSLELVEAGADAAVTSDSGIEAGIDAGVDSGIDSGIVGTDASTVPDGTAACVAQGNMCSGCCRGLFTTGIDRLEGFAISAGCICGAGQCTSSCASTTCATPEVRPAGMVCGGCVDHALVSNGAGCPQAQNNCANDPQCNDGLRCLKACP